MELETWLAFLSVREWSQFLYKSAG